jgi:hypothetical protein
LAKVGVSELSISGLNYGRWYIVESHFMKKSLPEAVDAFFHKFFNVGFPT